MSSSTFRISEHIMTDSSPAAVSGCSQIPHTMGDSQLSRRAFLSTSAAAAGTIALPYFVPQRAFGANDRIRTGHIGVGKQGTGNLERLLSHAVAVCDVDARRLASAAKLVEQKNGACQTYSDFRRLLDRQDIDAVVISTPDHWHAIPTILACQAGKDVYCEKPLTLTIAEGRQMVQAARQSKRVVQTGSQQRSANNFRLACELVRNGYLGKLQEVLVGIPGPNHPGKPIPDSDPPAELDYNFWLGPAPWRPYNKNRVHYNFRFFRDYSGGQQTNWGAHHLDIAQWGLGMDGSGPVAVHALSANYHPKQWHEVTESCRVVFHYAGGVKLTLGQRQKGIPVGTTFIGTQGRLYVNRGKLTSEPGGIIEQKPRDDDLRLQESTNHHGNFLDCIKTRELPICDVEIGHRSATLCHLANIACQLRRKLVWDPQAEEFPEDSEANGLLSRTPRQDWKSTTAAG